MHIIKSSDEHHEAACAAARHVPLKMVIVRGKFHKVQSPAAFGSSCPFEEITADPQNSFQGPIESKRNGDGGSGVQHGGLFSFLFAPSFRSFLSRFSSFRILFFSLTFCDSGCELSMRFASFSSSCLGLPCAVLSSAVWSSLVALMSLGLSLRFAFLRLHS